MPCALEAQTVIKTFCLWLAIPTCWRIGESKKLGVFKTTQANKQKTTQPTTNQNDPKRHLGNYVKHYAFRKSPSCSVLLTTLNMVVLCRPLIPMVIHWRGQLKQKKLELGCACWLGNTSIRRRAQGLFLRTASKVPCWVLPRRGAFHIKTDCHWVTIRILSKSQMSLLEMHRQEICGWWTSSLLR